MARLVFLIFLSLGLQAQEWSITQDSSGKYFLTYTKKFKMVKNLGDSKVIEVKEINKNYQLIIYVSGVAGTSDLVEIQYAGIFSLRDHSFTHHFPYRYNQAEWTQPVWTFSKDKITVKDVNSNIEETIYLK